MSFCCSFSSEFSRSNVIIPAPLWQLDQLLVLLLLFCVTLFIVSWNLLPFVVLMNLNLSRNLFAIVLFSFYHLCGPVHLYIVITYNVICSFLLTPSLQKKKGKKKEKTSYGYPFHLRLNSMEIHS